jgi:hypothetical protein
MTAKGVLRGAVLVHLVSGVNSAQRLLGSWMGLETFGTLWSLSAWYQSGDEGPKMQFAPPPRSGLAGYYVVAFIYNKKA